jgi:resuscitation-promoting factor RpfB
VSCSAKPATDVVRPVATAPSKATARPVARPVQPAAPPTAKPTVAATPQRAAAPTQAPAAPPVQAQSCDSNYSGACLDPLAADYDCAGGQGDGPKYTGLVNVVGDDHFDLDSNGDGVACEAS